MRWSGGAIEDEVTATMSLSLFDTKFNIAFYTNGNSDAGNNVENKNTNKNIIE